jgi:hypothetical protein
MTVEPLHAAIARACLDEAADFEGDLRAHLERHGVAAEDVDAILSSPRRLGLYRQLVRNNVMNVAGVMLERTRARLEHLSPGAWERTVAQFLAEVGPKTPHLRDVPGELLAWAAPRWRADAKLPAWLVDYAELELVDFTIGVAPRPLPPPPLAEVAPDRPLVFADPKTIVKLGFAVHEVAADDLDATPPARAVAILVYRDAEHSTRMLELTPLAGAILERLIAGAPLAPAIQDACAAENAAISEAVLGGAARMLADLAERGVLLGARG